MKKFRSLFTFILSVTILAACSNAVSDEEHEHPEADGFLLKMNGEIIAKKLPDQSIEHNFPDLIKGENSEQISIYFVDHHGDEFQPDDADLSLDIQIADTSVAVAEQSNTDKWSFTLFGKNEGSTSITLFLMHNQEHQDFETAPIPITVKSAIN